MMGDDGVCCEMVTRSLVGWFWVCFWWFYQKVLYTFFIEFMTDRVFTRFFCAFNFVTLLSGCSF